MDAFTNNSVFIVTVKVLDAKGTQDTSWRCEVHLDLFFFEKGLPYWLRFLQEADKMKWKTRQRIHADIPTNLLATPTPQKRGGGGEGGVLGTQNLIHETLLVDFSLVE